jgi:SAM-dependent methyltransferase
MRLPDAYDAFALVYDRGLGQLFFDGVRPVLDRLDREYPSMGRRHLDLACGTGLVVRYFRGKGFASIGLDASLPMLDHARRRGDQVFAADFRDFALRRSFDRITCLYDSLNHMMDEDDLAGIFRAVRSAMGRESLFWFDLNHPSSYAGVWSIPEPYEAKGSDWRLSIDTRYEEGRNLAIARVTGSCVVGSETVEIDELHHQRAWSDEDVRRILSGAGLEARDVFRFNPFGFGGNRDEAVKLMYVAALS